MTVAVTAALLTVLYVAVTVVDRGVAESASLFYLGALVVLSLRHQHDRNRT